MAFLDNSGDIILDAVLTDAGRQRLARGDGTFKITQFALGDDEINYGLYDYTNASGSAYYDLDILQTPILEAFTNNIASLNSKLLTIPRKDLTHLPVIKLANNVLYNGSVFTELTNTFIVLADSATETQVFAIEGETAGQGIMRGYSPTNSQNILLKLEQGLDTTQIGNGYQRISQDLLETQYIVELDNRLATIIKTVNVGEGTITEAAKSFVDDDNIAQYYFSNSTDSSFVSLIAIPNSIQDPFTSAISGPKGTEIRFTLRSSIDIQTSEYLFDTFGQALTAPSANYKVIKSNIVVTGDTTGYSVTIPVSFVKYVG